MHNINKMGDGSKKYFLISVAIHVVLLTALALLWKGKKQEFKIIEVEIAPVKIGGGKAPAPVKIKIPGFSPPSLSPSPSPLPASPESFSLPSTAPSLPTYTMPAGPAPSPITPSVEAPPSPEPSSVGAPGPQPELPALPTGTGGGGVEGQSEGINWQGGRGRKLISKPIPPVPDKIKTKGATVKKFTAVLEFKVNEMGSVTDVQVVKTSGDWEVDRYFLNTLKQWKFEAVPGREDTGRIKMVLELK